ncbi:Multifunctional CCA protein [Frankliniella fusca]|uniref:Multifunctional CCA protein n=1 Tax=Frankliniella fusca TaxID=407009 RepID=A0AAE1LAN6_9NEOP|nr:Multifunctional CCA protein [Frankliniella fusca]
MSLTCGPMSKVLSKTGNIRRIDRLNVAKMSKVLSKTENMRKIARLDVAKVCIQLCSTDATSQGADFRWVYTAKNDFTWFRDVKSNGVAF